MPKAFKLFSAQPELVSLLSESGILRCATGRCRNVDFLKRNFFAWNATHGWWWWRIGCQHLRGHYRREKFCIYFDDEDIFRKTLIKWSLHRHQQRHNNAQMETIKFVMQYHHPHHLRENRSHHPNWWQTPSVGLCVGAKFVFAWDWNEKHLPAK